MLAIAVAAAGATIVAATETFQSRDWISRWQTRGINLSGAPSPWLDSGYAAIVTAMALLSNQSPAAAASIGLSTWLLAFSARSDLATGRIPREPAWAVLAIGLILALATFSAAAIAAAITTVVVVTVVVALLVLLSRGGLGSGDARLLVAVAPVAAFTGTVPFLIGLGLAAVTQLVLRTCKAVPTSGGGHVFAPALCFGLTVSSLWGLSAGAVAAEWRGILPL